MNQDRLAHKIEREIFEKVYGLSRAQPWLSEKSGEVMELLELSETAQQQDLVLNLLNRFHYVSDAKHRADLKTLAATITEEWNCDPFSTQIVALSGGELADSSSMVAYGIKTELAKLGKWQTHNFSDSLAMTLSNISRMPKIVIVDEFAGTGSAVKKKIEYLHTEAHTPFSIRVGLLTAMDSAINLIDPLVENLSCVNSLQRGITDHFSGSELSDAVKSMTALEKRLARRNGSKKIRDYEFGYNRSEALHFSEAANPPNNNFPIFWWPKLSGCGTVRKLIAPRI